MVGERPVRVGDGLPEGTIRGFYVTQGHAEPIQGGPNGLVTRWFRNVSDTADWMALEAGASRAMALMDDEFLVNPDELVREGPDPLAGLRRGVHVHKVGDEWAKRFRSALTDMKHPWADGAEELLEGAARTEGYHLMLVGGIVRNLLLGADPVDHRAIHDLDIVGTVPPGAFRRICFEHQAQQAGASRKPWLRNGWWHIVTSPRRVVHVRMIRPSAEEGVPLLQEEPSIQYASLKLEEEYDGPGKTHRWLFGTSFADDAVTRDIRYNALLYDPNEQQLLDPTGHGLLDLGLSPQHLLDDPAEIDWNPSITVFPIDLPTGCSPDFRKKGATRVLKQILDFRTAPSWWPGDRERWAPNFAPIGPWAERNGYGSVAPASPTGEAIRTDAAALYFKHKAAHRPEPDPGEVQSALGPILWELISPWPPDEPTGLVPRMHGTALLRLEPPITTMRELQESVWLADDAETRDAAEREFKGILAGHVHVSYRIEGTDLLALAPSDTPDSPDYLELVGSQPIQLGPNGVAEFQRLDENKWGVGRTGRDVARE